MQVLVEGRALPRLRSRKVLWLLALLVLRKARPVDREWLAGTLWPDADQSAAATNLRVALSALRRALGSESWRLQSPARHTLSFNLDGADVDAHVFDEAAAGLETSSLERAAALYRGPLLEGCAEGWAEPERAEREQRCLQALQTLADAAVATGDWAAAVRSYQRAISLDPWREASRRGLMRALAQSGDTNAALEVYQSFVRWLRKDDPRASPDEETVALYSYLRAEARLRASAPARVAHHEASDGPVVIGYLPHSPTDLVGREDEREDVLEALRRSRLVTLTGAGGIGKTRLVIAVAGEAAPEFAQGVCLVSLEALTDGRQIALQVASTLRLKEGSGRTLLEILIAHLRSQRVLLVLDNCEHLLDASAELAGRLLEECAGLQILATSREALGVTGEVVWMVPALSVPDPAYLPAPDSGLARVLRGYESVQLFMDRAQDVQKTFLLTRDNARAVAQICAHIDGIPLAVELAAARVGSLTVHQIAERLDDHLAQLTDGGGAAQSRQQTLRATLDWSYALLSPSEQRLLECVSVFSGGWTLEAAEEVCSDEAIPKWRVLDLLISLVDKSLVAFDATGPMESGRYRLLEMVRQYADARLSEHGWASLLQIRHRDWFFKIVEAAKLPYVERVELERALQRLDKDYDNLREALHRCERDAQGAETGLRITAALWRYWAERRLYSEGRAFLNRALALPDNDGDTAARALALKGAGMLADCQGDYISSRARYEQSLRIFRALGDRVEIGLLLGYLYEVAYQQGDAESAQRYYEEVRAHYKQSLIDFRDSQNSLNIGNTLLWLSSLTETQGMRILDPRYYEEAQSFVEEAVDVFRKLGDMGSLALALSNMGVLAYRQGNFAASQAHYELSLSITRELGDRVGVAMRLNYLGVLADRQDDFVSAKDYYEQGLSISQELGDKSWIAIHMSRLDMLAYRQGDYVSARVLLEQELLICSELGELLGFAAGLERMATVTLAQADVPRAVRLWGSAHALRDSIGAPLPRESLEKFNEELMEARSVLGEDEFAALWDGGRAITWEQALDYALTVSF